jgi:hypothetical protein
MATTTPNFGWSVPTSSDLVKNGAVAIETLGDSIDASLVDLKGGTTGQVLKKATNTDMDFVWSADSAGMTNPMTTTGDTIYSSSGSTPARLGIGSTGQVLTVAGGVPSWATPAGGGGKVLQVVSATKTDTFTTTSASMVDVTDLTVSITPAAASSKILVLYDVQIYGKTGTFFGAMNLVRTSTAIKVGTGSTGSRAAVTQVGFDYTQAYSGLASGAGNYLDAPSTTSATTYKIQVQRIGGTGSDIVCINRSNTDDDAAGRPRTASTITVMEIGA